MQQRVDSLKATLKRNQDKHDEWKEESSVETAHLKKKVDATK